MDSSASRGTDCTDRPSASRIRPSSLTVRRTVEAIEVVTDDEIRHAMRFAVERLKIVLEPSGATGIAALLAGRVAPLPKRTGVILSGGNVVIQRLTGFCLG